MKIRLLPADRRPPWPWWAVTAVAAWVVLGCSAALVAHANEMAVTLCVFKRLTGIACPTCGASRGAWRLLHGDVLAAVRYQPFLFIVGVLFVGATVLRVAFARRVAVETSPLGRGAVAGAVIAAFLANWAYVIWFVG